MGVFAYLFKFPPEQLMGFDDEDIEFWRGQADAVVKALQTKGT